MRVKVVTTDWQSLSQSLYNLGNFLRERDRFDEAESLLRRELALVEKREETDWQFLSQSLYNLGNFLREQGRLDEAEDFLRRELQIAEKIDGPDSESVAESLQNLGVMLRGLGKLDASAPLLQRAVEIIEKIHGTNSIKPTFFATFGGLYFFASAGLSKLALTKNAATSQIIMAAIVFMVPLPFFISIAPAPRAASRS